MCYRESFILFPRTEPKPVVWGMSYHHELILRAAYTDKPVEFVQLLEKTNSRECPYLSIECTGGVASRWEWDERLFVPAFFTTINVYNKGANRVVLPAWMVENVDYYYDKVERILEKINPLRDKQDRLTYYIMTEKAPTFIPSLSNLDLTDKDDSEVVQEFCEIIRQYLEIPGFVISSGELECYNRWIARKPIAFHYADRR